MYGPSSRMMPRSSCGMLVVAQNLDPTLGEPVDRGVDVVDPEVEDRVVRRRVVGLGVDDRRPRATVEVQREDPVLDRRLDAEGVAVELLCRLDVGHGEAAEGLRVLEHDPETSGAGELIGLGARRWLAFRPCASCRAPRGLSAPRRASGVDVSGRWLVVRWRRGAGGSGPDHGRSSSSDALYVTRRRASIVRPRIAHPRCREDKPHQPRLRCRHLRSPPRRPRPPAAARPRRGGAPRRAPRARRARAFPAHTAPRASRSSRGGRRRSASPARRSPR